jgi:transcriptional regulator with XRE-family HTH domain
MESQSIGIRIKQRRNELGLKQLQIKELTGISSGNLSDIENGKKLPSTPALLALSETLDCSIDWILKGESPENENIILSSERENELLNGFRQLDQDDQDELMGLLALKLRKVKRDGKELAKLSNSEDGEVSDKLA